MAEDNMSNFPEKEYEITLNNNSLTSPHQYSKSDIRPKKKSEKKANLSSIKLKKELSDTPNNTFNFFEEVGFDLENEEKPDERSSSKIHKDMEIMLGHMYNDNGLTVVSEEPSKQFTEYHFGKVKREDTGSKTNFSESNSKGSSLKHGHLGKSIDDVVYMNRFKQGSDPRRNKKEQSTDQFMTQQAHNIVNDPSLILNTNSKSDLKLKNKNKKKRFKEKMRISLDKNFSELLPTIKSNSGNVDEFLKPKNKIDSLPQDSYIRNSKFKTFGDEIKINFDLERLPRVPKGPEYQINLLSNVKSSKAIDKKQHFIESMFFRLPCGLFYEGSLHFGKLQGKGVLLLKSIDISDTDSKEVQQNLLYDGFFYNNEVEGKGILNFQEGVKFIGTFKGGVAHGNGIIQDQQGNQIIKGIWINGQYCQ
jgi:hypothetical protein